MRPTDRLRRARQRLASGLSLESHCVSRTGQPLEPNDEGVHAFSFLGAFEADGGRGTPEYTETLRLLAQVVPWWMPAAALRTPGCSGYVEPAIDLWIAVEVKRNVAEAQRLVVAVVDKALARAIAIERKGTTQ